MPFQVQVGPPQIAIHQAMTVQVTESDGQINWPSDKGLYFFDTRLISAWSVYANGTPWDLLNGGAVNFDAARIFLTNQAFLTEDGPIPKQTLAFELSRFLNRGWHEDLDIANHGQKPVRFQPGDRNTFRFRGRLRREGRAAIFAAATSIQTGPRRGRRCARLTEMPISRDPSLFQSARAIPGQCSPTAA